MEDNSYCTSCRCEFTPLYLCSYCDEKQCKRCLSICPTCNKHNLCTDHMKKCKPCNLTICSDCYQNHTFCKSCKTCKTTMPLLICWLGCSTCHEMFCSEYCYIQHSFLTTSKCKSTTYYKVK